MDKLVKWLENLLRAQKKSRAWRTFVSCLAAIVVFTTTYYAIKATDAGDFIDTESGTPLTNATDGRYIINKPNDAVALPSTGGPGTKLFYGMGIAFVVMAGLLLFIRKRNIRSITDLSERRW